MTSTVTPEDLATFLQQDVNTATAQLVIDLAVELCLTVVDPLPDAARAVVLDVARSAYSNPQNATSQTAGPYSIDYGATVSGGLYLSRANRSTLLRLAGRGSAFSIDPTPTDAGTGLPPWDSNVTWLEGVPLVEDR